MIPMSVYAIASADRACLFVCARVLVINHELGFTSDRSVIIIIEC